MLDSLKLAAVLCVLIMPAVGAAAAPDALAAKAQCTDCHATNKKILGPSFHDVAAKYHGDPKAAAALAAKVRSGGKGVWGPTPMPPSDANTVSDADLAIIIDWVLKQ
jgi:cytochrome c